MGSPCRNFKISDTTGFNSAEICRTYRPLHGVFVGWMSWLWLNIWWREAADKMYIFEFSKTRISNNFEENISKESSNWSWCLWPSNSIWHLVSLHLVMKLLNNKDTLETCKNPRPTSGWSELAKSCTTSTVNFHMAYFYEFHKIMPG